MAVAIQIADPDDHRLDDYRSLRDVSLRKHLETEHGLFIAEGEKVVRRAVQAGYAVRSFLMTARWFDGLTVELDRAGDVPCYVVSVEVVEQITGFHVHRGALASLHRRALPSVEDLLDGATRILVLEDIVDHTNVGAILRCAAALGIDAVFLSPRCADPLYRRSIKVAMGAVFSVPWTRLPDRYDAIPRLQDEGFLTVALTPAGDALDLGSLASDLRRVKVCLVIGSEGPGLTSRWLGSADVRARIPMHGDVDSLNVAAATAVACYLIRAAV
ncbi:MAG: RNA methyltransferase [Propionibacteriales bacterium]|nr:RNA methyltransferase [Propionibacteriales bacterium]